MNPEAISQAELEEWYKLQDQLRVIKDREMELRKKIFMSCFPTPVEGTNSLPLDGGFVIKGKHVITRKPMMELINLAAEEIRASGVVLESLIKWDPSLVLSEYRKLNNDQRYEVDKCLEIKAGSPGLEIVQPKR